MLRRQEADAELWPANIQVMHQAADRTSELNPIAENLGNPLGGICPGSLQ